MKLSISKEKLRYLALLFFIFFIELSISIYYYYNANIDTDDAIRFVSFIICLSFVLKVITWKKFYGEIICPYLVFFIVLFMFSCGQCIGWCMHFSMASSDMWNRNDYGLTHSYLLQGLLFSMPSLTAFHLGAVVVARLKSSESKYSQWNLNQIIVSFKNIGKVLLIIVIPSYLANIVQSILAVYYGGYGALYTYALNRSFLGMLLNIIANYYQPCMMLLLIGYKDKTRYRWLILFMMLTQVVMALYIGGRSGAVLTVLGILLAYHYFISPFAGKKIVSVGGAGYFGLALLNAIVKLRGNTERGIIDYFNGVFNSLGNTIPVFIGELGWNITSVCWTMMLVPVTEPYRFGMSYVVSLLSWVPSGVFPGGVNPVYKWAELGDWLQNVLNMPYGPGYTMFAEAYINFSWFGIIAVYVEGMIIGYFLTKVKRKDIDKNYLDGAFQIIIIMTIMKSLTRSSVCVALRQVFYIVLPLYFLVKISLRTSKKNSIRWI